MFLNELFKSRGTLVFRLTVWYAGIFTISSLVAFFFFYLQITSVVRERTDEELLETGSELAALMGSGGIEKVKSALAVESRDEGIEKVFYRLLTPDGRQLAASDLSAWGSLKDNTEALRSFRGESHPVFETLSLPGREHKVRILYTPLGAGVVLQTGWSLEDDDEFLAEFHGIFGTTVGVVMVFAALLGWLMAKRALSGVEEVTRTAREISAGDFEQRVPVSDRDDEIKRLATTFNGMLDRIQAVVVEMREMTDNIAHDLRSPITRVRGAAELTLTTSNSVKDYQAAAADTIEECDRLLEMINTMLDISEAEAATGILSLEQVDMTEVVRNACELFKPVADDKGVSLVADIRTDLKVRGQRQGLQRMVANLIDNAINYTPSKGTVTVVVEGDESHGVVRVKDTGIGISPDEIPRIFRRFYRCDQSRTRKGTGLGLSLVKAIVHSHRGQIDVTSVPNSGSHFAVTLPRSPRLS